MKKIKKYKLFIEQYRVMMHYWTYLKYHNKWISDIEMSKMNFQWWWPRYQKKITLAQKCRESNEKLTYHQYYMKYRGIKEKKVFHY